jgi:hypothetical protein
MPYLFRDDGYTLLRKPDQSLPIEGYPNRHLRIEGPLYTTVLDLAIAASDAWHAADACRNVCLATNNEDGWPHPTVLASGIITDDTEIEGVVPVGPRIFFSSYPYSRHSVNLARDNRASFVVFESGLSQGSFSVERAWAQEVPYSEVPKKLVALNALRARRNIAPRRVEEYNPADPHSMRLYESNFDMIMLPVRGFNASGRHIQNAAFPVLSIILTADLPRC